MTKASGKPTEQGLVPFLAQASGLAPEDRERVRRIFEDGSSPHSRRAMASDLRYFEGWYSIRTRNSLSWPVSPTDVVLFITDHLEGLPPELELELAKSGLKKRPGPHSLATVRRRVSSLSQAHRFQSLPNPCETDPVRSLLSKATKRDARHGRRPAQKQAATRPVLEEMLRTCTDDLAGVRDRALLMFGFSSGGRRRSEISEANFEDLDRLADGGYIFHLRRSKTDADGLGLALPLLGRAGVALDAWIKSTGFRTGPIFRAVDRHGNLGRRRLSPAAIAAIVKRRAAAAGLDSREFAGHSLRSGFVTEAGRQGLALGDTMALSGHKAVAMALRYYQPAAAERNPAARLLDSGSGSPIP